MANPKARIRLPAGGNSGQAITVTGGAASGRNGTNVLPAKEWSVSDDVLNLSDSASFTVANVDGENSGRFYIGQRLEIDESDPDVAGGQWTRIFTGIVIGLDSGSDTSGGSVIAVSAMDLGWCLTSCSAPPLLPTTGITLSTLCSKLIHPTWGFQSTRPTAGNAVNRSLKQGRQGVLRLFVPPKTILPFIQVEPGQTPMDVLQTYAQREGLLINVGARGDLILFQPNYDQEASYETLRYHSDSDRTRNNIQGRPTFHEAIDGRYSEVQCWSTVVKPTNVQETAIANNPNAQYRHASYKPDQNPLPFYRLMVFSDGEAITPQMRKNRATWKWQMDYFNSWTYSATKEGHSSGGRFYTSDTMQSVDDAVHKVAGTFYVQSVTRSMTLHEGATSKLTVRKPILNPNLTAQLGGGARKAAQIPAPVK
jgi:prophage tail gpP-like protein